jgi:DNA mismatch endonuclease, patch repair protein
MPDVFTPAKRSAVMAAIRGKGNKDTELRMMALLRAHGITGWRRGVALFGKPDFVFRRERVALFVDGCFWHGCPRHATTPANNHAFWKAKLGRNAARDREVTRELRKAGWRVVRVWECALARSRARATLGRIDRALAAGGNFPLSPRGFVSRAGASHD